MRTSNGPRSASPSTTTSSWTRWRRCVRTRLPSTTCPSPSIRRSTTWRASWARVPTSGPLRVVSSRRSAACSATRRSRSLSWPVRTRSRSGRFCAPCRTSSMTPASDASSPRTSTALSRWAWGSSAWWSSARARRRPPSAYPTPTLPAMARTMWSSAPTRACASARTRFRAWPGSARTTACRSSTLVRSSRTCLVSATTSSTSPPTTGWPCWAARARSPVARARPRRRAQIRAAPACLTVMTCQVRSCASSPTS